MAGHDDANPYRTGDADQREDPLVGQAERLAAIHASRLALLGVAPVLGGALSAEYAPQAFQRCGLRGIAALLILLLIVYLVTVWYRVGQRCRPIAARAVRLGIVVQLMIHAAVMTFVVIRQVGEGKVGVW